jgi:hypothetical protein
MSKSTKDFMGYCGVKKKTEAFLFEQKSLYRSL